MCTPEKPESDEPLSLSILSIMFARHRNKENGNDKKKYLCRKR